MRFVTRTVEPAVSSVTLNLTSRTKTDRWISVKQSTCAHVQTACKVSLLYFLFKMCLYVI